MTHLTQVLIALAAFACGPPLTPDPEPLAAAPSTPVSEPAPPAEEPDCSRLPELACILSDRCTLVVAEGEPRGYLCRDSAGPCETGFRQRGDGAEECESKPGCRFVPGRCYCPPDVTCICGGGPPPQCVEDRASTSARRGPSWERRRLAGRPSQLRSSSMSR